MRSTIKRLFFTSLFSALAAFTPTAVAFCQSIPELVTDRPDQTESAQTVPSGWLQIETGVMYEQSAIPYGQGLTVRTWTSPAILFRYGLVNGLELRLGSAFVVESQDGSTTSENREFARESVARGTEALSLGFKYCLTDWESLPIAAMVMFALPSTVAGDFAANNPAGELRIAAEHSPADWLSLGINLAAERDFRENQTGFHYTAVAGLDLITDFGFFIEVYGSQDADEKSFLHRFDGGLTALLDPNLQIDFSAGVGISGENTGSSSNDWFVSTGISYRFAFTGG